MKRRIRTIWPLAALLAVVVALVPLMAGPVWAAASPTGVVLLQGGAGTAEWSTAQAKTGSYSAHLDSVAAPSAGDEARVVIPLPSGTTLGDIDSISWWVYAVTGYPPHVDITLHVDEDGVVDPEDMLTAEMNLNYTGAPSTIAELEAVYPYGTAWLQTFELTPDDGFDSVNDTTELWVTKLGAGNQDAPSGTLAQWKAGIVASDPFDEMPTPLIDATAPVVKLEIEVDSWVVRSEAYLDDVTINGVTYDLERPLDSAWYKTGDTVTVTVTDPSKVGTVSVYVKSDIHAQMGPVALTETGSGTGIFVGTFKLVGATPGVGELLVGQDNTVQVGYPGLGSIIDTATVDNAPPTIDIVSPAHLDMITTATPTIEATLLDLDSGIDPETLVMTLDGEVVAAEFVDPPVTYTPIDNLDQGSHSVTVDVSDVAGNPATTESWSFAIDSIPPEITDLTPGEDTFVDTATPEISATFTEDGTGIDTESVKMRVDGDLVDADVTAAGVSYMPTVALEDGSHDVTVDVADNAENPAETAEWSFTVDTTDPVITIDELEVSTYLPTLTMTGTYVEVNLDTITVNGVEAGIIDHTWTAGIDLSIGPNEITAMATDLAGNTGSDTATIEYKPLAVATVMVTTLDEEILADGVSTTEITVLVQDESIVPIAGMTVTLETTAGIIYPTSKETNVDGVVTVTLTSEAILGEVTVTATCEDVSGTATVAFVADSAAMPNLVVGWNLISLPLIPVSSDIDDVLEDLGIAADVDVVWSYDAATRDWSGYHPSTGMGELTRMEDGKGYWVRMLAPAEDLTVTGFEMPAPGETPRQYAVAQGWNLIGIKSTSTTAPEEYLAAIQFTSVYGFDQGGYFFIAEDDLEPGFGYWVFAMEEGYIAP